MPGFQRTLRRVLLVAASVLGIFLLLWLVYWLLLGGTVLWIQSNLATYAYYLRILTTQGGMEAWLGWAISLLFAIPVYFGVRLIFSMRKRQRQIGRILIFATCFAFNIFVYIFVYGWTSSAVALEDGRHFVQATGQPKVWYYVSDDGEWELFPKPGYHPRTGEPLNPMTAAANREYEKWKLQKAGESSHAQQQRKKRLKEAEERRFRDLHIGDSEILAQADSDGIVVLALKAGLPDTQTDVLRAHIAQAIKEHGKKPISTLFKPAFCASGLFDKVWNGDQYVLERLQLLDKGRGCFLFSKADFSCPEGTDFQGFVSVQGTLSLLMVAKHGAQGPWTFSASGVGNNAVNAQAHCAKRLAESIDFETILRE